MRGKRLLKTASSALIFFACSAHADPYDQTTPNATYLSDYHYTADSPVNFLDTKRELQLHQQWQDANRSYEAKQNAGTLTMTDQMSYNNNSSAFAQAVFQEVQNNQINQQKNKAIANLKNNPDTQDYVKASRIPVMIAAGAIAVYRGTSYTVKTPIASFTPGVSVKNRSASMGMSSAVVNTSVSADQNGITTTVSRGLAYHVSINYTNYAPGPTSNPPNNTISLGYGLSL